MEENTALSQSNSSTNSQAKKLTFSKKNLLILATCFSVLIIGVVAFFSVIKNSGKNPQQSNNPSTTQTKKENNAIAKVGNEYIYKKDLDAELANFPGAKDDATKKRLITKLVKDSIILQAAQKDKIVELTNTVYNSPEKDYMKRITDIKHIEKAVNAKTDQISGTMVSIWFHNQNPAKIGIEAGKQEALKRITVLQKKVADKEITIEDAGKLIITDPSYADLDIGYQNNALIPFSYQKGKQITIDKGFDEILWQTKEGEVTPVYLGKNANDTLGKDFGKEVDAFYIFGQVKKKIDDGNTTDFTTWYEKQKNNYEITYY